jgi:D-alanine-D-alanine ligase-like ATP-grasp enzyme/organic radical activating enzyme
MPAHLREILDDKWQTKCLLRYLGFSIPEGMIFKQNEFKKAREYAKKLLPVTIKPINGCHGEGVRPNIETIEEFDTEFKKLVKELRYKSDFLVEKNIFEDEYRLVTTRDGFFAAVYRIRPKVTGDGKKSIKELIRNENYRRMHPRNSCLCEIWTGDKEVERYLRKQGLNLDYIPRKGQNIVLRANVNVCTGAECMDITDLVHPFYKYLTLKVLSKVPNLPYCSVDIFTEDITKYKEGDKYYIGEINPDPGISLHTHPNIGTPRNLPAALIDLIFPETKKEIVGKLPRNTIINKKLDTFSKLKNYFSQKSPKNWFIKPMAVEIEITTKCNLRCKGCYMLEEVKKGKENLSAKEILNLLKQVEKIGIYAFALTGGEALLRLDDVCEIIKKANIDLQKIQTNGSHFTSEEKTLNILNKLKKAGIDKKNKYLKPTINCSIGMQTEAGVPLKNAAILIKCISEVFGDKVNMAINIGVYKEEDGDVILKNWKRNIVHSRAKTSPTTESASINTRELYTQKISQKKNS